MEVGSKGEMEGRNTGRVKGTETKCGYKRKSKHKSKEVRGHHIHACTVHVSR